MVTLVTFLTRLAMSRWSELMKQPKAKIVTVTNQLDEYDGKGKKFLISDRVTPSFESFVTDVNDKLAPPGVALRNIYTAQHGHKVRWDNWTEIYIIYNGYECSARRGQETNSMSNLQE